MTTLLVYFSRSGLAKRIANDYKIKPNTDVLEIKVSKNYGGPIGFIKARVDSIKKNLPPIEHEDVILSKYDRIILVGSVWTNNICSPLLTFLDENKGKLKNCEYIAISKRRVANFCNIFAGMDYVGGLHFKRATAISVKFNRIISIKRY